MDELTIAFKIESPPSWLPIGRTAENNWRTVEIDCSYWFNMSADGEVVLMYKPSCGMSPYPLLTEREGDNIIWRPKSGELVEGVGRLQAFFEVGTDVIGSSDMISCEVDSSLLGVEPGTDPGQTELPWALDIIEQIAELSGHYPKIIDGDLYIWDSTLNEWVEFEAGGSGAVESVNGKTGVVVLDATDVHALPDSTVIPVVPQMATAADMSDWTQGKTVDAGTIKTVISGAGLKIAALEDSVGELETDKADKTELPTKTSDLTNDSGFVTAQQAAAAAPVQSVNGMTGAVTIPTGSSDAVLYTPQSLSDSQKAQARTNVGAGTYSKPSGGIPASDLASGVQTSLGKADTAVQPSAISDMATETWVENKGYQTEPFEIEVTQSGSTYSTTASAADILAHQDNCVAVLYGTKVSLSAVTGNEYMAELFFANSAVNEDAGYTMAQQINISVNNGVVTVLADMMVLEDIPSVTSADDGKFLRVVNGAWAAENVPSAETNSFGGGA